MARAKILVVTKDPVMLRFIQINLDSIHYQILHTEYADGEVKTLVEKDIPSLIILDAMMPSLDGIEASLYIRQWCHLPIIILSCWGAGEGKIRALDLSADCYLTEPFDVQELVARIKDGLKSKTKPVNIRNASFIGMN